jgi:hypothetical protein
MTLCIGTDEAGYGPNLGPLVVAATAWHVEGDGDAAARIGLAMAQAVPGRRTPLWADSKQLYKPGPGDRGIALLEEGVVTGLCLTGSPLPADWPALAEQIGTISPGGESPDWDRLDSLTLPRATSATAISGLVAALEKALAGQQATLRGIVCRAIYPEEFNASLTRGLNKADILSQATLELRGRWPEEPALVWCDRHGGRKSYAALLGRHFAVPLVQTLSETPACSAYALPAANARVEFAVGGESRVPVALASMTAKYVRELAMLAFNAYWSDRVPGLRPTAGYPLDARRWRQEIGTAPALAGVAEASLWRTS